MRNLHPKTAVLASFAASLALAASLASCLNPFEPIRSRDAASGTVSIDLVASLTGAAASAPRSVVVDFASEATSVVVAVTGGDEDTTSVNVLPADYSAACAISGVTAGSCSVTVTAYKDALKLGSGTKLFNLTGGGSESVSVPVEYLPSGTGGISLTIEWPLASADYASATLDPGGSNPTNTLSYATAGGTCTASIDYTGVGYGTHAIKIVFRNGGASGPVVGFAIEAVTVWSGLTSSKWLDPDGIMHDRRKFSAAELFDSTAALADISITGLHDSSPFDFDPVTDSYDDLLVTGTSVGIMPLAGILGQTIGYAVYKGEDTVPSLTGTVFSGTCLELPIDANAKYGIHRVYITVTAPDRDTSRTYELRIIKAYELRFNLMNGTAANGDSWIDPQIVKKGESFSPPVGLERVGYAFGGWYTDDAYTTAWEFPDSKIFADTTLYAKWTTGVSVTVSLPFAEPYRVLSFDSAPSSVERGNAFSIVAGDAALASVATGWKWYVDGVCDTRQTGPSFKLDAQDTASMSGTHVISCEVPYGGIAYSGSHTLSIVERSGGLDLTPSCKQTEVLAQSMLWLTTQTRKSLVGALGIAWYKGYLYVADTLGHRVLKIDPDGWTVEVLAGTDTSDGLTDGPGSMAKFDKPTGLCAYNDVLYVSDSGNHTIRAINLSTRQVTALAGMGSPGSANGVGFAASFNVPYGLYCDGTTLYVADSGNKSVRAIRLSDGNVSRYSEIGIMYNGYDPPTSDPRWYNYPRCLAGNGTSLYLAQAFGAGTPVGGLFTLLGVDSYSFGIRSNSLGGLTGFCVNGSSLFVSAGGALWQVPLPFPAGYYEPSRVKSGFSDQTSIATDGALMYVLDTGTIVASGTAVDRIMVISK